MRPSTKTPLKPKENTPKRGEQRRQQSPEPSTSRNLQSSSRKSDRLANTESLGRERHARKQMFPQRKVMHDIRRLQASTMLLIPKRPFSRVVREIFVEMTDVDLRVTPAALEALQESAELYIVQLLEDSYMCTLHRDRKTLLPKDVALVRFLRGRSDPGNR